MPMLRREFVRAASLSAIMGVMPCASFAELPQRPRQRLVFVILRGAMDGLSAVPPVGDPDYATLRRDLALASPGAPDGALLLDARFGLHPSLGAIHPLFGSGELLVVHAMASPYRERSHFDAQNLLENGTEHPHSMNTGWLNRMLGVLGGSQWSAMAIGDQIPLVLQGPAPVTNWKPQNDTGASASLLAAVGQMWATDAALASALERGINTSAEIQAALGNGMRGGDGRFAVLAEKAGYIMAPDNGPAIGVLEIDGWDMHVGQGSARGRLPTCSRALATD